MMLDANIWIAYLYLDDALHTQAVSLVEDAKDRLGIFEYSIIETATALAKLSGKETADRFLQSLENNRDIQILLSSPTLFEAITKCYKTHAQRALSFADYALLHLSHTMPVATFDAKLRNAIRREEGMYYSAQSK